MSDQAQRLRDLVRQHKATAPIQPAPPGVGQAKVIAITSGKGGVGKSNFTLNFGLALKRLGCRVVIWDADFGFSNLHVLMGTTPRNSLLPVMQGKGDIWSAISQGPEGMEYISSGNGVQEMYRLAPEQLQSFLEQFLMLRTYAEYLLIDLGAGLNEHILRLLLTADEVIFVTTPEPTSLTDAYAVLKMMSLESRDLHVHFLINRSKSEREGAASLKKLQMVSEKFLNLAIHPLGQLADDPHVVKAVKKQVPYLLAFPQSRIARQTMMVAQNYIGRTSVQPAGGGFWRKFVQLFNQR